MEISHPEYLDWLEKQENPEHSEKNPVKEKEEVPLKELKEFIKPKSKYTKRLGAV